MSNEFNAAFRDFVKRGKFPSPNRGERLEIRVPRRGMAHDSKPVFKIVSDAAMNDWSRQKAKFKSAERARYNAAMLALDEQQNLGRPSRQVGYGNSTSRTNSQVGQNRPAYRTKEFTNVGATDEEDDRRQAAREHMQDCGMDDDDIDHAFNLMDGTDTPDESEGWEEQEHVVPRSERHGERSRVSGIPDGEDEEAPEPRKQPQRLSYASNSRQPARMSHGNVQAYVPGAELKRPTTTTKDRRRGANDAVVKAITYSLLKTHPKMTFDERKRIAIASLREESYSGSNSFIERFPEAARIGHDGHPTAHETKAMGRPVVMPRKPGVPMMASDEYSGNASFNERFPSATRIEIDPHTLAKSMAPYRKQSSSPWAR